MSSILERATAQFGRRHRQGRDILKQEGLGGITKRVRTAAARWLQPKETILEVRPSDVLAADLSRPFQPRVPDVRPDEPITINWIVIPPSPGSGGHTTEFRIINYLQAHGYENRVYFYDVYRGDRQYYESIVRNYYGFHGYVGSVDDGMADAHAVVATAWATAYPLFNARCAGKRFYLVQDFEPSFYSVSSLGFLAENTYRMGFHAITAGAWLSMKLSDEYQMAADFFEFGCDTSRYKRLQSKRSGVVFYCRPEAPRRAFELGVMALEVFAARRPDVPIHFYGSKVERLSFPFQDHGHVSPDELNRIYNECYAGLSLSLTNVSLVPHEMLAAGCIPVVNDGIQNRIVLDNPFIHYTSLDPHALAAGLEQVVTTPDFESLSASAASSVSARSWDDSSAAVEAIFRRTLGGDSAPASIPAKLHRAEAPVLAR